MAELNIEQILQSERAWEYILLDIVKSEDLNPWDIDITKLTESYTERINKMKKLDLRIPARLILAAAILLKMQSEQLVMSPEQEELYDEIFGEPEEELPENEEAISILDLRVRRKPVRKVTLGDLINNLQKALEKQNKKVKYSPEPFELKIEEVDISEKMNSIYSKILKKHLKKIAFSDLLKEKNRNEIIGTLMPLLHLANEHKIELEQDEFFKELFIMIRNKQNT